MVRCQDCGREFQRAALQMHRLDPNLAHDRSQNFGYVRDNVILVCAGCHDKREAARR